jgi:NAD+ kinase
MVKSPSLRHIAVLAHPQVSQAIEEAERISQYLQQEGIHAEHSRLDDDAMRRRVRAGEFDLLIALGGDGTILRAGHLCAPSSVPILGINMGRFGFLIEIGQNEWLDTLPKLLQGNYWLERRMMLHAEQWRQDQLLGGWDVVNEALVSRGHLVRPVHLTTYVDSLLLTTYVADGLIAATPTGSTAYALSAGGPILPPELRNILIVPVAPHLSVDRAIVLAEGSTVSITIRTDHQAILSIDGQAPVDLQDEDRVTIRASEHSLQLVRFQDPGYFYRILTSHMNQRPSNRADI